MSDCKDNVSCESVLEIKRLEKEVEKYKKMANCRYPHANTFQMNYVCTKCGWSEKGN